MPVKAQGWYRDPYAVHQDRYFSAGRPTKLVRDGAAESYDPPPPRPPVAELVEVTHRPPADGSDLRRVGPKGSRPSIYDYDSWFSAIADGVAVIGPVN
jgi:hypothetical protein